MSLVQKIPKNWLFETDTESKICLDPGSTETVSRYFPALIMIQKLIAVMAGLQRLLFKMN